MNYNPNNKSNRFIPSSGALEYNEVDGIYGSSFLDEDNMASNSATAVASQQSIKSYVDSQVTQLGTKLDGIEASATAD
jgi:hypothetical protein